MKWTKEGHTGNPRTDLDGGGEVSDDLGEIQLHLGNRFALGVPVREVIASECDRVECISECVRIWEPTR